MASSKEYLELILGQLSELEEITYRAMMGEFIIYYRGKIVGGIYDDRLLEVTFRDGSQLKDEGVRQILVDKETGVNYLCWKSGYGAAITPLLDSEGKVIVTK